MSFSKSIVSGLARLLEEEQFSRQHLHFAGHMHYGKQVHQMPEEIRVLGQEYHGTIYHLRRAVGKAGLYLMARYSLDGRAREMAAEKLKR